MKKFLDIMQNLNENKNGKVVTFDFDNTLVFHHEMLDDDHGDGVHNHLCPYITIILRGGYWETTKNGRFWRKPGYIGFRSANSFHRVDLEPGTKPMTIFIPGPFGLRKGPRSEYGIDFKTKRN